MYAVDPAGTANGSTSACQLPGAGLAIVTLSFAVLPALTPTSTHGPVVQLKTNRSRSAPGSLAPPMVTFSEVVPAGTTMGYVCCAPPEAIVAPSERALAKALAVVTVETAANSFFAVNVWAYVVPTVVGSLVHVAGSRVTLNASNVIVNVESLTAAAREAALTTSQTPVVGPV